MTHIARYIQLRSLYVWSGMTPVQKITSQLRLLEVPARRS